MMKQHRRLWVRLAAAMAAIAMVVAGCGGDGDGGSSGGDTITIGAVKGWTDQTGMAYLFKNILEDNGYTVNIKELGDNAPIYAGLAKGDLDLLASAWPERTHKQYWDRFGDDLEDLGTYYEGAALYLAVPTYSDMQSIADLPDHAAELDGKVIGIEPGAGLTKATKSDVFPSYGLGSSYELVTSSTTAMLAELKKATEAKREIVVTLWRPFWANQSFPVRPLKDPKEAFGKPEGLHTIGREGFSEDFSEVAEMIDNFKLTDKQYGVLEDTIVNEYGQDKQAAAVQDWLDANPDFAPSLTKYLED